MRVETKLETVAVMVDDNLDTAELEQLLRLAGLTPHYVPTGTSSSSAHCLIIPLTNGATELPSASAGERARLALLLGHKGQQRLPAALRQADDFVCACSHRRQEQVADEIRLRVDRLTRRARQEQPQQLAFDDVRVDLDARRVYQGEREVTLTPTELKLLIEFLRQPEHVLPIPDLLERVWGDEHPGREHYVRVYVHRLRSQFGWDGDSPTRLATRRGQGYCLTRRSKKAAAL